jgi:hypothetical protein
MVLVDEQSSDGPLSDLDSHPIVLLKSILLMIVYWDKEQLEDYFGTQQKPLWKKQLA